MSQAASINITSAPSPEPRSCATVNRRDVVALAAVAVILGTGAKSAEAAVRTDPVFALIDAQRDARRRYEAARDATEALLESLPDDVTRAAMVQTGRLKGGDNDGEAIYAFTHDQIEAQRGWAHCLPRKQRAAFERSLREWKNAKHAALREDEERQARLQTEAGLTEAKRLEKIADDEEAWAMDALLEVTPTTVEGALAVVSYLRECDRKFLCDYDELDPGYRSAAILERFLTKMVKS